MELSVKVIEREGGMKFMTLTDITSNIFKTDITSNIFNED